MDFDRLTVTLLGARDDAPVLTPLADPGPAVQAGRFRTALARGTDSPAKSQD